MGAREYLPANELFCISLGISTRGGLDCGLGNYAAFFTGPRSCYINHNKMEMDGGMCLSSLSFLLHDVAYRK